LNKKTLGTVLKHVKKLADYDEAIIEIVDAALDKRNYLVHHFFRTHNFAINSVEGRKEMLVELQDIQQKLTRGSQVLYAISENLDRLAGRVGSTEETAKRLAARGKKVTM